MATKTWTATGSGQAWSTTANWTGGTLPTTGDDVIISGSYAPSSGPAALAFHSFDTSSCTDTITAISTTNITIQSGGYLVLDNQNVRRGDNWNGANTGTITATFNGSSRNNITVNGTATFNGSSTNYYGTVNGTATFNGSGGNYYGTVNGTATFNGSSGSFGSTVNGTATFNGSNGNSYGSTVNGTATFNGSGGNNYSSTVYGTATFNGSGGNSFSGKVNGTATFNGSSSNNGGAVYGVAYFAPGVAASGTYTILSTTPFTPDPADVRKGLSFGVNGQFTGTLAAGGGSVSLGIGLLSL